MFNFVAFICNLHQINLTMKKILFSILIGVSTIVNAQNTGVDHWSIGYGVGMNLWPKPISTKTQDLHNARVSHHDLNVRYMFNNRHGLMLDFGYDFMDFKGLGSQNTNFYRVTLQGVVNAGDILKLHQIKPCLGLLVHGGMGFSMMSQKSPTALKDNMMNFVAGVTPQFRIAPRWSIKADFSIVANYAQAYTYDFERKLSSTQNVNFTGIFFNASLGLTFHIGKNKNHLDWVPTNYGSNNSEATDSLKMRIQQLETMLLDDDKDGVPNSRDKEVDTPEGAVVNSLGEEITLAENNTPAGPDADGDGVVDNVDECPDVFGKAENNGCPLEKEQMVIIKDISNAIYFGIESFKIKEESYDDLDKLITILKQHEDVQISIEGYADAVGSENFNKRLSKNRAISVKEYLVNKGINADRIGVAYFGEDKTAAPNNSKEGRAKNRRVEIHTSIKEIQWIQK